MSDNNNNQTPQNGPNWAEMGDDIRNAVINSVNTGDISYLGDTVMDKAQEILDQAIAFSNRYSVDSFSQQQRTHYSSGSNVYREHVSNATVVDERKKKANLPVLVKGNNVGGIAAMVTGGATAVGTGIATGVLGILTVAGVHGLFLPTAICGFMFACGMGLFGSGASITGKRDRAKRYARLAGGRTYINLQELSDQTGKSVAYLVKDIRRLIDKGIYPQGHLDKAGTCLMLSDSTYKEYLEIEKERKERELEELQNQREQEREMEAKKLDAKLVEMIRQGEKYVDRLHELNEEIPGEVITNKLFRMESTLREIFSKLEDHPEAMPRMKKTMDYFLPTTIKLVEAYGEYDRIPNPNDEIRAAKIEVEKTIDTINESFTELLNQLFQQSVMDVTSDAAVLKTMLAREGLTPGNDPFAQ